jgi:hypothetical protein
MARQLRSRSSRFALAVSAAAFAASLAAGAVSAGEINGTGDKQYCSHGRSVCTFSGLNDNPSEAFPFGGRVQSYGYSAVRNGLKDYAPSPGDACTPNGGSAGASWRLDAQLPPKMCDSSNGAVVSSWS